LVLDKIILILANYLDVSNSELDDDTMLFFDYDLEDEDVEKIIGLLNDEFYIEIDIDTFCEFNTIGEIAEYIESLI